MNISNKLIVIIIGAVFLIAGTIFAFQYFSQNNNALDTEEEDDGTLNVMVSILPQVNFVNKVGGEYVNVEAMIREGFSPATYEPIPEQMKRLAETDLYFRIGHVPFEKTYMEDIAQTNPEMSVIDTSEGVSLREIEAHSHDGEEEHEEDHEGEGDHEDNKHEGETGDDPHIWLSPQRVKIQVEHIYNALVEEQPENQEYFLANKDAFIQELDALDKELKQVLAPFEGKTMFVYHPAFGYLADDYGFKQEHFQIQGKDPSIEEVQDIIAQAQEEEVTVIFVQKQFSTSTARAIAEEINGSVIQIDPLAQDYITNMKQIANTIAFSSQD